MKHETVFILFFSLFFFISCVTSCATKKNGKENVIKGSDSHFINDQTIVLPAQEPELPIQDKKPSKLADNQTIVAEFDTVKITKETFDSTKTEIELVVEDLNKITISRDYQKWLQYLSLEYRRFYSSPIVLKEVSDSLPVKGIQLNNLKDYFNFVFVPSRQNMRVDDIKFVSSTRVYVIMEIAPGSPAAIYILEKTKEGWNLVLKNQ